MKIGTSSGITPEQKIYFAFFWLLNLFQAFLRLQVFLLIDDYDLPVLIVWDEVSILYSLFVMAKLVNILTDILALEITFKYR
jgi:hypothetical protein